MQRSALEQRESGEGRKAKISSSSRGNKEGEERETRLTVGATAAIVVSDVAAAASEQTDTG